MGEVGFLQVKNWERFQHYGDRRAPPWIKLYNDLLENYEFAALPDASKAHVVAIWLLASRSGNRIPADPRWIAARINATEPVDLPSLLQAGFLEWVQGCSGSLDVCQQDASKLSPSIRIDEDTDKIRAENTSAPRNASPTNGAQQHGKRNATEKGTRLPADWLPCPEDRAFAEQRGLNADVVAEEFRNYWITLPGTKARKLDWSLTFHNRCLELARRGAHSTGNGGGNRGGGKGVVAALRLLRTAAGNRGDDGL